jgi:hypothetical protein
MLSVCQLRTVPMAYHSTISTIRTGTWTLNCTVKKRQDRVRQIITLQIVSWTRHVVLHTLTHVKIYPHRRIPLLMALPQCRRRGGLGGVFESPVKIRRKKSDKQFLLGGFVRRLGFYNSKRTKHQLPILIIDDTHLVLYIMYSTLSLASLFPFFIFLLSAQWWIVLKQDYQV